LSQFISLDEIAANRRPDQRNRWQIFTAAPHRMLFSAGFVQLLISLLWWLSELLGRYSGGWWPVSEAGLASAWLHAFMMVYGVFPFFIFGFLLTTYPRWMNTEAVPAPRYIPIFMLMAGGMGLFDVGLWWGQPWLVAGLGLYLLGYAWGLYALFRVYWHSTVADTRYERLFNLSLLAGWIGILWYLSALLSQQWLWLHYAIQVGLWVYLLPLLVGVCHRMIPYFSSAILPNYVIYRPFWMLPVVFACAAGHALLSAQMLWAWRPLVDMPLMLLVFYLSYRWGLRRSFSNQLLAVLHVAFAWLGVALLLFNLQSLWLLGGGQLWLAKAPLHALTLGFMLSLVVGMASRVSLGHSGRMLFANRLTWYSFWGIGLTAVLRILAELPVAGAATGFNLAAALLGCLVVGSWASHYLPMLLRPRADGQPG